MIHAKMSKTGFENLRVYQLSENEINSLQETVGELTPKLSAYIRLIGKNPIKEKMNEITYK